MLFFLVASSAAAYIEKVSVRALHHVSSNRNFLFLNEVEKKNLVKRVTITVSKQVNYGFTNYQAGEFIAVVNVFELIFRQKALKIN